MKFFKDKGGLSALNSNVLLAHANTCYGRNL